MQHSTYECFKKQQKFLLLVFWNKAQVYMDSLGNITSSVSSSDNFSIASVSVGGVMHVSKLWMMWLN